MIDSINRINKISILDKSKKQKNTLNVNASNIENIVAPSLIESIIADLKSENNDLSKQTVQKTIIYKTLLSTLGEKAVQEPKFKELFQFIDNALTENKDAQALIEKAIEKHKL